MLPAAARANPPATLPLQALSNAVFAFDKAGLLRKEFLSGVFEVAGLRLAANEAMPVLTFKPQVRGSSLHSPAQHSYGPVVSCSG
jgi:hypothetical protein